MGGLSEEAMQEAEHWFCLPVVMLINFSLFQYLVVLYYRRRAEPRIALLLVCAFLGFATLVPQAHPRDAMVGHLNDISETCSTLTFLIQITTIGRDIERKVRIWSLKVLTYMAELLTVVSLLVVVLNFLEVFSPSLNLSAFDGVDNVVEIACLFFVFFFRFFYITMSRGWKWTLANKKLEIFLYVLFTTHELPFLVLEASTGVSWEPVQAIWHRITLMMCILMTIKEKLSSNRTKKSKEGRSTAAFSKATSVANAKDEQDDDDDSDGDAGDPKMKKKASKHSAKRAAKPTGTKVGVKSSAGPTMTSGSRVSSIMRGLSSLRGHSTAQSVGPSSFHSGIGKQSATVMPAPPRR